MISVEDSTTAGRRLTPVTSGKSNVTTSSGSQFTQQAPCPQEKQSPHIVKKKQLDRVDLALSRYLYHLQQKYLLEPGY